MKDDHDLFASHITASDLILMSSTTSKFIANHDINMNNKMPIYQPLDFKQYVRKLSSARDACLTLGLVPVYYFTSPTKVDDLTHYGLREHTHDLGLFFSVKGPCSLGLNTKQYVFLYVHYANN